MENKFTVALDYNKDGKLDVATTTIGPGYCNLKFLTLFENNGDGTFMGSGTFLNLPQENTRIMKIYVTDFNNDGNLDIISQASGDIVLFSGRGDGKFDSPRTLSRSSDRYVHGLWAVENYNNDGNVDILVYYAQYGNDKVAILEGDGKGNFDNIYTVSDVNQIYRNYKMLSSDMNGDGKPDILIGTGFSQYDIYINTTKDDPEIIADVNRLNFGSVNTNETFKLSLYLGNNWTGALTISALRLSGPNAEDYSVVYNSCTGNKLEYLAQCKVEVLFTSTKYGEKNAILIVDSNDPVKPELKIPLSGISSSANIMFRLPDTGLTKCYGLPISYEQIQCTSPSDPLYGQDANYNINAPAYIKLDIQGNALPDSSLTWSMVRDSHTGLIWEIKTDDDSIHDKDNIYSWEGAHYQFISKLNEDFYGGYSDWRLPTIKELIYITYFGSDATLAINDKYYANMTNGCYWSSTPNIDGINVWGMEFLNDSFHKGIDHAVGQCHVMAVRGAPIVSNLVDNGDGTVTDHSTGLMWQKNPSTQQSTWFEGLSSCENLTLGGYTDWRMPNIKELISIFDFGEASPTVNKVFFPNMQVASLHGYWSSTTNPENTIRAWLANFHTARIHGGVKQMFAFDTNWVLAVRNLKTFYANFTGAGIWKWNGKEWTQATASNPDLLVTVGSDLYGTFPGMGIWKYNGTDWEQTTTSVPEEIVGTATTLYGTFTGLGIWEWNGTAWSQTTPSIPQSIIASTSDLYGTFEGMGIWKWDGSAWSNLTTSIPDILVTSGVKLYGTFPGAGIWLWDGTQWTQATGNTPQRIAGNSTTLYGAFEGAGIWSWAGSDWTQISADTPTQMVASEDALYAVFAGVGIRKWDGTNWTTISGNEPVKMVVGN